MPTAMLDRRADGATAPRPGRPPRGAAGRCDGRPAATSSCSALTLPAAHLDPDQLAVDPHRLDGPGRRPPLAGGHPDARAIPSSPAARRAGLPTGPGRPARGRPIPGRPFFMITGASQASWAPASSRAPTAWASCSPVASSTLASSSDHRLAGIGVGVAPRPGTGAQAGPDPVDPDAGHHLGAVGQLVELPGAGPEPLAGHPHGRHRPVARRQGGEQGRPGRRGQLHRDVPAPGGHPFEQGHHRRRRVGQHAVGGPHHPEPGGHRAGPHLVDARAPRGRPPSPRCRRWCRGPRPRGSGPGPPGGGGARPRPRPAPRRWPAPAG